MNDLISRQATIELIERMKPYHQDADDIAEMIANMPSAQPELIRCKDCKHMIEHKSYGDMGESAYTCEGNMDGWVLPDSYCSYAERRADDLL